MTSPLTPETLAERYWWRINSSGCWILPHALSSSGYVQLDIGNVRTCAHRLFYEAYRQPIPHKLTLDHLCRNRACVNPKQLEPVTMKVNALRGFGLPAKNARKTRCSRGHMLSGANLVESKMQVNKGWRQCRKCKRITDLRYLHAKKSRLAGTGWRKP